jgi:hypothetical protein
MVSEGEHVNGAGVGRFGLHCKSGSWAALRQAQGRPHSKAPARRGGRPLQSFGTMAVQFFFGKYELGVGGFLVSGVKRMLS